MNNPDNTTPSNTDQRSQATAGTSKSAASSYTNPVGQPGKAPAAASDSKPTPSSMDKDSDGKAKWGKRMSAAKLAWSKLSEAELLKSEGHEQKLATLVKERYSVSQEEADKQIKRFFETNPA